MVPTYKKIWTATETCYYYGPNTWGSVSLCMHKNKWLVWPQSWESARGYSCYYYGLNV